ncbi:MarR family winged helix-turn-helix transcriptional regulator [Chachezhania sediminis]|uniref:MarR family winged helix-turn-helix transcriptional regulator n=1 Tax=Chachezhania sediminis TaxID=2599291 RepID=UPI00131CA1F8|nr:MarR family winged helix-turn-helix transcriptional regulator [Chachezhania sediminis]
MIDNTASLLAPDPSDPDDQPDAGTPFLDDYLLFLLASVSQAASEEFHAMVRARGLRVPEWRVLACLYDRDGQMVTRVAQLSMIEQSRLTRIVDQMQDRGLVERRSDMADRRRVRLFLTAQGAALATEMVGLAKAHEAAFLDRLPVRLGRDMKARIKDLYTRICPGD